MPATEELTDLNVPTENVDSSKSKKKKVKKKKEKAADPDNISDSSVVKDAAPKPASKPSSANGTTRNTTDKPSAPSSSASKAGDDKAASKPSSDTKEGAKGGNSDETSKVTMSTTNAKEAASKPKPKPAVLDAVEVEESGELSVSFKEKPEVLGTPGKSPVPALSRDSIRRDASPVSKKSAAEVRAETLKEMARLSELTREVSDDEDSDDEEADTAQRAKEAEKAIATLKQWYAIAHSQLRDDKDKLKVAKDVLGMVSQNSTHQSFLKGMGLQIVSALCHCETDDIRKVTAEAMTKIVANKRNFANSAKDKKDAILRSQLSRLGGVEESNQEIRVLACQGLALLIKHMAAVGKEILVMPNAPTVEALFEYAVNKKTPAEGGIKAFQAISRLADFPENRGPIIETPGLLKRLAIIAEEESHPSTNDASRVLAKLAHTGKYAQTIADVGFFGVISLIEGTVSDQILCAGAIATLTKLPEIHDTLLDVGDELVALGRKDAREVKVLMVNVFCTILVRSPQLKYSAASFIRDLLAGDSLNQSLFLKFKPRKDSDAPLVPESTSETTKRPGTAHGARSGVASLLEEAEGAKKKDNTPKNPNYLAPPKRVLTPLKVLREICAEPFDSAFFESSLAALQTVSNLAREETNHVPLKKDAFSALLAMVLTAPFPPRPLDDEDAADNSARTALNEAEILDVYKVKIRVLIESKVSSAMALALMMQSTSFHKTFLRRMEGVTKLLELARDPLPDHVRELYAHPDSIQSKYLSRLQKWILVMLGNLARNPTYRPQLLKENLLPYLLEVIPEMKLRAEPRWTDNSIAASKKMHGNVVFAIQALFNLTKNADIGQELEESGAFHKLTPLLCENDLLLVRWTATTLGNMVNTMTSYPQMEESLPLLLRLCDIQLDPEEYFRWGELLEAQLAAAEFLSNFAADNPDTLDHIQPFDGLERVMQMCNRYLHVLCVAREGLELADEVLDLDLIRKNLLPDNPPTVEWRRRQVPSVNWEDLDMPLIIGCNRVLSEGADILINIMTHVPDDDIEDFTNEQASHYMDYAVGFIDVDGEEDGFVSAKAFDDERLQHAAIASMYRLVTCDKFPEPSAILRKHEDTTGFICLAAGSSNEDVQSQSQQIISRMVQEFTTLSTNILLSNYITDIEKMEAVHFNLPQALCNLTKSPNEHLKKYAVAILCNIDEGFMPLKEVRQQLLQVGALNIIVGLSCSTDKYLEMYGMKALSYLSSDPDLHPRITEAGALNKLIARCTDYLNEKPEQKEAMASMKTVRNTNPKSKTKAGKKYTVMDAGTELSDLNRTSLIDPALISADPKHLFKICSFAMITLANLARYTGNRQKLAEEGGIDLFISLLGDSDKSLVAYAAQGIAYLALENELHGELSDADTVDRLIECLPLDTKRHADIISLLALKRKQWEAVANNANFRRGLKHEKGASRTFSPECVQQARFALLAQTNIVTALGNLASNPKFVNEILNDGRDEFVELLQTSPDARVLRAVTNTLSELCRYESAKEEIIKHCLDSMIDLGCMPVVNRDPVMVKMMVLALAELGAADRHRPSMLERDVMRPLVSIVNSGKHHPKNQILALHCVGDMCEFTLLAEEQTSRGPNLGKIGNLFGGGEAAEEPVEISKADATALLKMTSTFLTSTDDDTLMAVVKIIQKLAECSPVNHTAMLRRGFHEHLVRYTQDGEIAQEIANLAVIALTFFAVNEACIIPLIKAGAIQPIIRLGQSASEQLQKRAVEALLNIAPEMKKNSILEDGLFEVLSSLARSEDEEVAELAQETQAILFGERKSIAQSVLGNIGAMFKF